MPKIAFKHQEKVVSFCVVISAYWYWAVCGSYICIYQAETIFPFTEIRVYKMISQSFFFFLAMPWDMQGLSSLTKDRTCAPCGGSAES